MQPTGLLKRFVFVRFLLITGVFGFSSSGFSALPIPQFGAPTNFPISAYEIQATDLNNDGNLDLIAARSFNSATNKNFSISLGNGDGSFQTPNVYNATNPINSFAFGDINSDGWLDIATANYSTNSTNASVSLFLNQSNGTVSLFTNLNIGTQTLFVSLNNLNGDSNLDLFVGSRYSTRILFGNGNGGFNAFTNYNLSNSFATLMAPGDFDANGERDFLMLSPAMTPFPNSSYLLSGNGNGTFVSNVIHSAAFPGSVEVTDLNLDGNLDYVVLHNDVGGYLQDEWGRAFLGNGNGTFDSVFSPGIKLNNDTLYSSAVGDFNGDGKPDLVLPSYKSPTNAPVYIYSGLGNGKFERASLFIISNAYSVVSGDFNNDGKPDFATGGFPPHDKINVFLNESAPPLEILPLGNDTKITWPNWAGYFLESTTNFPFGSWNTVTNQPTLINNRNVITNAIGSESLFFRLRKSP